MIWYILYPFRGTTEPPRLSPTHPIRRAFQLHGTATAQHWLLSILLTVVISVLLCYPALFHPDSPAAVGLRNLPKHVWTSTTEVDGDRATDVDVRQVWVHGDYMKAIDLRVLRQALYVQGSLIGRGFGEDSGLEVNQHHMFAYEDGGCAPSPSHDPKWSYHSPLMYWNCSLRALEADNNILATINALSDQKTFMDITLRPSTVFAGKTFANTKLRSADALVITLFDRSNNSLGEAWQARTKALAAELPADWSIYPRDGQVTRNRLYEFRFEPMTFNDDLFLALSYCGMAAYVVWRMRKLRAFKSWIGLLITIFAKMTICVIASFTVCSFLGINLVRIPREYLPGVVLVFGLGNIFRLINEVLATPPEMPPVQRIGNAIGEVGHLSLAVAFQNLVLIYLCSKIVTPWVADFCAFAAVTLVFDFVYHLTFFLAVLSVDVQRMELQDSLERINLVRSTKKEKLERQSWLDALRQGNIPVSTRFAGSAAIVSMIVALNQHFFDSDGRPLSVGKMFNRTTSSRQPRSTQIWSPPPINQARTPADWLRIQEPQTARELIGFIKPGAHKFVARVFDPVLIVLNAADGRDPSTKTRDTLLEVLQHMARDHAFPAALLVVFLIGGVTLLMNYLLWHGGVESVVDDQEEETPFSVKTLPNSQTLDIARLSSCPKGHVVSISLDRSTSVWLHHRGGGYSNALLQTATMKPKLWPIVASAVDDNGTLLALCSDRGQIGLWSIPGARFLMFPTIDLRGQIPVLFSFTSILAGDHDRPSLIILTPDGYLTELDPRTGIHRSQIMCPTAVHMGTLLKNTKGDANLVFVSKPGEVHIVPLKEGRQWTSEVVAGLDPGPPPDSNPNKVRCVYASSALGLIFALRLGEVEIIGFSSRALIHTLQMGQVKSHTFRVMHSAPRSCHCGAPAVHSLSIVYTEPETNQMIMHTFTVGESASSLICLAKPSTDNVTCKGLDHAEEAIHYVDSAGVWETTHVQAVIGIRKTPGSSTPTSSASGVDSNYFSTSPSGSNAALKLRGREGKPSLLASLDTAFSRNAEGISDTDSWEAWTLSFSGEFRSRPLMPEPSDESEPAEFGPSEQLFVASPGPMTRLGKKSVAVGFGNSVKIITLGKETFDGIGRSDPGLDFSSTLGAYNWRPKRTGGRKLH